MPKRRRNGKRRPVSQVAIIISATVALGLGIGLTRVLSSPGPAKGYVLNFGKDFQPGLASRDDLGVSLVVAVDSSGSMGSPPATGGPLKYQQATSALGRVAEVVERLARDSPPGQILKVGVIRFSDGIKPVLPLTLMDAEGLARLSALAQDPQAFAPGGNTAIGLAIERGAEWLAQSGTILRSLIVVTDGENTEGVEPGPVLEALYANRNSVGTPEYPVYTSSTLVSFIGFDIEAGRFRSLADLGARVASASDSEELAATISGILEADVTKLEAAGPGARP